VAACYNSAFPVALVHMATISPFRAWRYAGERVPIRDVVTQPYDKITPAMQETYYDSSPYNLVRIILGRRFASDNAAENVYTRAEASLRDWRKAGVLRQDLQPSLYRYWQSFKVPGSEVVAERRGFIGLGRIEEYSAGVVFRHEQTLAKPKADRLDLLRATRAHFGQLFMLYNGSGAVDATLHSASSAPADTEVTDEYDVIHRVWRIDDPGVIASVQEQMRDRKLIIADGHHRYETALTYRNERNQAGLAQGNNGSALHRTVPDNLAPRDSAPDSWVPHNWVMMTFVDMDAPGLVILPTHRVVFGLPDSRLAEFPTTIRKFFNVEEVDAGIDAVRASAILKNAGQAGMALLAVGANRAFLLHTPKTIGTSVFGQLSLRQQTLDVVQLHKCVLEGSLQISEDAIRNQQNVSYYREAGEALAQVRGGQAQMAFLMSPVRIEQMRDIAFAGEVLPQKSTDFYPKLLSGLTAYALE
jgi:uncharacterized protein (DUF1015 family)